MILEKQPDNEIQDGNLFTIPGVAPGADMFRINSTAQKTAVAATERKKYTERDI